MTAEAKNPPFSKVLIANRGEIALRIIRACHELGIKTVAVYSKPDVEALHVKLATEAVCIGPAAAKDSYLNIPAVISAAVATGAEAIHPGYGFLSENSRFAEVCGSCGITFIGPTVRNMRMMGDKARARRAAEKAGLPTIPGISEGLVDASEALNIAKGIGFPVLLKACAGGGGRGMKIINHESEFLNLFNAAAREVEAAFNDPSLIIEKYLDKVRHIEVQIAGDRFGNVVHLGIRDCSMQRRYQKLIEETPSKGLPPKLQEQIQDAAVRIAKHAAYSNVGTIEFLADLEAQKFYFIEMNTRLQVEHPVTEMATGIDLVKEQIGLAAGNPLSITQEDVKVTGHTMEIRINAEDPRTYVPSPGKISSYHPAGGFGVRVDSALYSGYTVQPYYDSMIGKLIVKANDREQCIAKTLVALDEFMIEGIKTNIEMQRRILKNKDFQSGNFHTKYLDTVKLFDE